MWYSVYTDIQSFTELSNIDEGNALVALKLHYRIMRKLLVKHQGFETNTEGDSFMIEFSNLIDALSFCIDSQITHLHPECAQEPDWPEAFLAYPFTQEMRDHTKTIIYRGLRVRMVVSHANDQSVIHSFSGRRRLSHETDMRMRDLLKQTIGGQIIIPRETFSQLSSNTLNARFVELRAMSTLKHNGMPLVSMYPTILQSRMYWSNVQLTPILGPGQEHHDKTGVLNPVTIAFVRFQLDRSPCITLEWCQDIINSVALDNMSMYQCEETYGVFVIAFNSPKQLLYFLKALFEKLEQTHTITQTGVSCGIPIHIDTHAVTGKTCYYGDFMQKASRLCDACDDGHICMAYSLFITIRAFMEHLKCFVFKAHLTQTFKGLPRVKVTMIKYVPIKNADTLMHGRRQSDPSGLSEFVKSFMDKSFALPVAQVHDDVPDHYVNDGYELEVDTEFTYLNNDEVCENAAWNDC